MGILKEREIFMVKQRFRRLAVLLAVLTMLTAVLTACADPKGNGNGVLGYREEIFDGIPEYDFDGEVVDFLSNEVLYSNGRNSFLQDEIVTGTIDQAIYERNVRVGEAFNVGFSEVYEKSVDVVMQEVDRLVLGGDDSYDIICLPARYMLDVAARDYLYSYDDLDNIDLHGDAWIEWVNDIIEINGVNFFAFSDAMLSLYDFTHMLLFNTKVLERYGIKTTPYDYVDNGNWTFDTMYAMMKKVSADMDADGKPSDIDMYGYVCPSYSILANFWVSAGANSVKKLANKGYFVFDLSGDDHFDTVYRWVFDKFKNTGVLRSPSLDQNRYYDEDFTFQTNHALFADHTFYSISQLRDMESDFGIVPYPKWDESQEQYYSRVEAGTKTWGVLYFQDAELTGTIIEALSRDSHAYLIHNYYDLTLQLKLTRDDKSIEMLDLIRSTMTYDPGDTLFCNEVRNGIFKGVFVNGNRDLASLLESKGGSVQSQINEKNDYFRELFGE